LQQAQTSGWQKEMKTVKRHQNRMVITFLRQDRRDGHTADVTEKTTFKVF
jgi:hypothetical protein